jgi:FkbM family methyltransferase
MIKMRHIKIAFGMVCAPWIYLLGYLTSCNKLYRLAISADPNFLRASWQEGNSKYSRHNVSQLLVAANLTCEVSHTKADRIKKMLGISESQCIQDIFCAISLNEKKKGFFLEVGVGNGRLISNTYMLEKHYSWSGILVEPNRSFHPHIVFCRTAKLDCRAAASSSGKKLRFDEFTSAGEHSRISGTVGHKINSAILQYDVQSVALTELLLENGAPSEIDYLSLDTEGSEVDILLGIDFNKFRFNVMTIEHNYDYKRLNQIDEILLPNGYHRVLRHISGFDAWYIHESIRSDELEWTKPKTLS